MCGGCGQLWFVQSWIENNQHLAKKSVGFGMDVIHAPTATNLLQQQIQEAIAVTNSLIQ